MRLFRTVRASGTGWGKSATRHTGGLLGEHAAGVVIVDGTGGQAQANSDILPASRLRRRTSAYQSGARRATGDSGRAGKRAGGWAEHCGKSGVNPRRTSRGRGRGGEGKKVEDRGDEVEWEEKWRPEVRSCRQPVTLRGSQFARDFQPSSSNIKISWNGIRVASSGSRGARLPMRCSS